VRIDSKTYCGYCQQNWILTIKTETDGKRQKGKRNKTVKFHRLRLPDPAEGGTDPRSLEKRGATPH